VTEELQPYKLIAEQSQTVILSNYSGSKENSNPYLKYKLAKKNKNIINIKEDTKRAKHDDKGKDRKFSPQKDAIHKFIQDQWDSGNPTTRPEVYDILRERSDCQLNTFFISPILLQLKQVHYPRC